MLAMNANQGEEKMTKWTNNREFDNQKTAEVEALGAVYALRVGRPVAFTDCYGKIPASAKGPFAYGMHKVTLNQWGGMDILNQPEETIVGGFKTVKAAKTAAEANVTNIRR
jgi:hypothetical protein